MCVCVYACVCVGFLLSFLGWGGGGIQTCKHDCLEKSSLRKNFEKCCWKEKKTKGTSWPKN